MVENVGGYRLIRKLGEGNRADVWLGHAGHRVESEIPDDAVMAIKVFRSSAAIRSIDVEIEALARASSPHLLELKDIATAPDGRPCLVLARLPGGSLAQLFARRESFSTGEMVTALAPVTSALAELHRVGVSHGGVAASAVLFDARAAPVLGCFGSAALVGEFPLDEVAASLTAAQLANEERVAGDLAACDALVRSFAARLDDPATAASLVEWLQAEPGGDSHLAELADRLYDLGDALPIRSEDPTRVPVSFLPRTPMPDAGRVPVEMPALAVARHAPLHSLLAGLIAQNPARLFVDRARISLRVVRRPVWVAAALGAGALIVAVAVIPAIGTPRLSAAVTPKPSATSSPAATSSASPHLSADDPLAATGELVAARARCIVARSVGCLDTVEQPASAALEADRYFLRQLQAGSTIKDRKLDATTIALVQRLGDSAIVGLGAPSAPSIYPASVLVVKVDGQWRIRDLTIGSTN